MISAPGFDRAAVPAVLLSVLGAALLVFLIFRSELVRWLATVQARLASKHRIPAVHSALFSLKSRLLIAGLAVAVICIVGMIFLPFAPSSWIGSAAVVFLAFSLIIPPIVLSIQVGATHRIPVTPILIGVACLFSWINDNHAVRLAEPIGPADRAGLADAWQRFQTQAGPVNGVVPVIFVAAEGGA
jgi:hypothetical protein